LFFRLFSRQRYNKKIRLSISLTKEKKLFFLDIDSQRAFEKKIITNDETQSGFRPLLCNLLQEYNFLPSFIFLLASCFSFVLDVARYAIEQTRNKLLNNQIKSVQKLMTDLG